VRPAAGRHFFVARRDLMERQLERDEAARHLFVVAGLGRNGIEAFGIRGDMLDEVGLLGGHAGAGCGRGRVRDQADVALVGGDEILDARQKIQG